MFSTQYLVIDKFQLVCDASIADLLDVGGLQLLPEVRITLENLDDFLEIAGTEGGIKKSTIFYV
jgi:hypothetical protein